MRIETDFLGEKEIPANALYGIHSQRAIENFPNQTTFSFEWFKAIGIVKLASFETLTSFKNASSKHPNKNLILNNLPNEPIIKALQQSAFEISEGKHFAHFIVPAMQGGAGTSINLNVSEIVANRALQLIGKRPGMYQFIDPIEQANIYQSTNDVIPTSLKIASMQLLIELETSINTLRQLIETYETTYRYTPRIGYTQMQAAVPTSYGRLFSTWADALSRDWWRVSKCFERIKEVNLGGGAIGSGLAIPRYYIMEVVQNLQRLTNLPLSRSENMQDNTSNLDTFVEIHAILKAHAVNLEKMVSDVRLLSSDVCGLGEMKIPQKQVGSSIMPGKVNPVIPEYAISVAHKVYANDQLITSLCAMGTLELNAYLPTIGHTLLESLKLLISTNQTVAKNLFTGLEINISNAEEKFYFQPSITTALSPYIGYNKSSEMAKYMKTNHCDIFEANKFLNFIATDRLMNIVSPQNLLKLGFSLNDLT